MTLFLDIILQLGSFVTSFAVPVTVALAVVGFSLANKKVLKNAFIAALVTLVAHLLSFGIQIYQAKMQGAVLSEIFSSSQTLISIFLTVGVPVILSVVLMVMTNLKYKKVS